MILAQELTARVLRTARWMAGLIIAVVMGTVALTARAATAGLALHKGILTVEFVRDWHQHAADL